MTDQAGKGNGSNVVPNAKDVSTYPGNAEGSVQPTTVTAPSAATEHENAERERLRLEEERKHYEELGS